MPRCKVLGEYSSATDRSGVRECQTRGPGRSYLEPLSPLHKMELRPAIRRLSNQLCIAGPVITVWLPVTHGPVWGWPPRPCAPLVVRSQESKSGSSQGSEVRTSEPGTGGPGVPLTDLPLGKPASPSAAAGTTAQPASRRRQQPGSQREGAPPRAGRRTPPGKTRGKGARREAAPAKPAGPACPTHP